MKPSTRHRYAQRVDRVVARLQQAVAEGDELPGLAELAALAHFSPYHFHRVWRALTGETVAGTVARLRLQRALHRLADPSADIADVALAAGYQTPQAFARAFRAATGDTPSTLRGRGEALAAAYDRLAAIPANAVPATADLRVTVVSIEPFEVVALRHQGAFAELDQTYGRLFGWAADAGLVERITGLFGVPLADHRDVPPAELVFDCAIRLFAPTSPAPPFQSLRLGGGTYAVLHHVGAYAALEAATDQVLADWLPDSGYVLRDAPIHYDYHDDPDTVPEAMLRAEVRVPVQEGSP